MFKRMQDMQCESVHCFSTEHHCEHGPVWFRAFIVIHNRDRGPALGGCRLQSYATEQQALTDAMRLAQGMSYKAALADIAHGGGKAVIMEPKQPYSRRALFEWFGDCVESLAGAYVTAMDAGTQVADMDIIRERTSFVASHSAIGDPSPYTAQGVFAGIRAGLEFQLHKELSDATVAVQGLGHVGLAVTRLLLRSGARVRVADPDVRACQSAAAMGAEVVGIDEVHRLAVDVFAPCAMGAVINSESLPQLRCQVVAGCANNQLSEARLGEQLHHAGILYVPDYVINAGGLIYAASRYAGHGEDQIVQKIEQIYYSLLHLFVSADSRACGVNKLADEQATRVLRNDHLKLTA